MFEQIVILHKMDYFQEPSTRVTFFKVYLSFLPIDMTIIIIIFYYQLIIIINIKYVVPPDT